MYLLERRAMLRVTRRQFREFMRNSPILMERSLSLGISTHSIGRRTRSRDQIRRLEDQVYALQIQLERYIMPKSPDNMDDAQNAECLWNEFLQDDSYSEVVEEP